MLEGIGNDRPTTAKSFRVLVVDDKVVVRDLFERAMKVMGHKVVCVEDGRKAIEKIKEEPFDIVFLDMIMPGMDGLETFKIIKELNSELPVVMMTGFAIEGEMKEALKLGAFDCLYKPFDILKGREVIDKEFKKINLKPYSER